MRLGIESLQLIPLLELQIVQVVDVYPVADALKYDILI